MADRPTTEGGVWGSYVEYLDVLEADNSELRKQRDEFMAERDSWKTYAEENRKRLRGERNEAREVAGRLSDEVARLNALVVKLTNKEISEEIEQPDRFMMATQAHHVLGDISRDEPHLAVIYGEEADDFIGEWAAGLGLINVRFPKATTRDLTDAERDLYGSKVIEVAGMVRPIELGPGLNSGGEHG